MVRKGFEAYTTGGVDGLLEFAAADGVWYTADKKPSKPSDCPKRPLLPDVGDGGMAGTAALWGGAHLRVLDLPEPADQPAPLIGIEQL